MGEWGKANGGAAVVRGSGCDCGGEGACLESCHCGCVKGFFEMMRLYSFRMSCGTVGCYNLSLEEWF
jgi:hypothetical protein